jgi:iron complex outermembrane receptor protein
MEYIDLKYRFYGFNIDNKAYTYSYWYPNWQNNAVNQTIEGPDTSKNGGSLTTINVPLAGTTTTTPVTIKGVANGNVTGHLQLNDYRAWGDILNVNRDLDYGPFSGQLRFGLWYEFVYNDRNQPYIDYTTGMTYAQLGNAPNVSTILDLKSEINNVQPYFEYEWKPTDRLSITPGYKWEAFTRIHDAIVNQTTLAPLYYTGTYVANLPFFTVRYKVTDEWSVYGQASKGFLAPTVSAFYVFSPSANSIAPQQTTNYQIGAVFKSRDLTADFALYQQDATNFPITYTYASQTTYENGGTARYKGAEFQGTYAFGHYVGMNGFAVTTALGVSNAKYIQGAKTGLAVGDAPRYTAAGGLIYDDKTFFGSLLQKVTGDQYGSQGQIAGVAGNIPTLNKIAAYSSTDFVTGYRYKLPETFVFGKAVELKVGVQNIFDHRAVADISGNPTGQTITTTKLTYTFQSGRYIYGAIKYSF